MAVNNEVLAINLAKKLATKINTEVAVFRSRRKTKKFYLAVPSLGRNAPRASDLVETVAP